jgi:O-antigen/teichoic acid export membrane protein
LFIKKLNNYSAISVVTIGRFGQALGQIIAVRVSTEMLSPAQLSGVTQLMSAAGLFNLILIVPVWHYFVRGFCEWHQSNLLKVNLKRFIFYSTLAFIISAILLYVIQFKFTIVHGISFKWVGALSALYLFSSLFTTISATGFNLLKKRVQSVIVSNIPIWAGLLLAIYLVNIFGRGAHLWALGQFLGYSVSACAFYTFYKVISKSDLINIGNPSSFPFTIKSVALFSWPIIIGAFLGWVQSQSYRFSLDKVQGAQYVGLFAMAYGLVASPMAMYEAIMGQYYEPIFYNELKGKDKNGQALAWNRYAQLFLPGVLSVGCFLAISAPFLAYILLGVQYRDTAAKLAIIVTAIEIMRVMSSMFYQLAVAKIDMRINLIPNLFGAVASFICVILFCKIDPLYGTAIGLLIAALLVFISMIIISKRVMPITWPFKHVLKGFVLSCPMIIIILFCRLFLSNITMISAVAITAFGGIYLVGLQLYLIKCSVKTM